MAVASPSSSTPIRTVPLSQSMESSSSLLPDAATHSSSPTDHSDAFRRSLSLPRDADIQAISRSEEYQIEMMGGASGETKRRRHCRPLKTKRKRKGCSIMKFYRDRCGDRSKSPEPEPYLVEMINQCPATREAATKPRKEDLESEEALLALYHRWCCFWEIRRTPSQMVTRLKYFRKEAEFVYKQNSNKASCSFQLFYFIC